MLNKCNCQHIFKSFEMGFVQKKAFKVQIIELKQSKRILKWIFEARKVIVQKKL